MGETVSIASDQQEISAGLNGDGAAYARLFESMDRNRDGQLSRRNGRKRMMP